MTANKMPVLPEPFMDLIVPVVREAWEGQMRNFYRDGYLAGLAAAKEAVPEAGHAPECTSLYEEGIFEGRFEIRKETLANIAALEKETK